MTTIGGALLLIVRKLRHRLGFLASVGVIMSLPVQALDFSNLPLFVTAPVDANILVTLDDSSSMTAAFIPELCDDRWANKACDTVKVGDTPLLKSPDYNQLYFNPDVKYELPLKADGTQYTTSFNNAYINGFAPDLPNGTVDLGKNYRPTLSYLPNDLLSVEDSQVLAQHPVDAALFPDRKAGAHAYYYRIKADCADVTDSACYVYNKVSEEQKENFANWYSFYRTRNLATASAATLAFQNLPKNVRVAWQALGTCHTLAKAADSPGSLATNSCQGWRLNKGKIEVSNAIRPFTGEHRENFYQWISQLPADLGYTPLRTAMRRAGEYLQLTGNDGPYDNQIGEDDESAPGYPGQYQCRPNFHVVMTDGMWNDPKFTTLKAMDPPLGNFDGNDHVTPDGNNYTGQRPFSDENSDTVADLALYYWIRDLRPGPDGLGNNLLPYMPVDTRNAINDYWNPKNNPATWQHMVNYFIGLGLNASLDEPGLVWPGSTYGDEKAKDAYDSLVDGPATWPVTSDKEAPGNVYDLWHAALNSRGQFYSANSPDALVKAFTSIFDQIGSQVATVSASAASSRIRVEGSMIYEPTYDTRDWTGDLQALVVNEEGNTDFLWRADDKLPTPAARHIYTWDPAGNAPIHFQPGNLTDDQKTALVFRQNGSDLAATVKYLRGDASMFGQPICDDGEEATACIQPADSGIQYRSRRLRDDGTSGKIGDILNSDPLFVGAADYGYEVLPGAEGASYRAFRASKVLRDRMIYVNANDGKLHGFNAMTGEEAFAYVPNAAILAKDELGIYKMRAYVRSGYTHRFLNDGSPFAGDVYLGGAWKTMLVSGMGLGGKAYFGFDITDPSGFDDPTSLVKWEFTDDDDLGYTYSQPIIVRLNNGKWAAVFGNGYNSTNRHAVLFIVDVENGNLIRKIDTGVGGDNGLTTPTLLDTSVLSGNGDLIADMVYAGDLYGNMWKFDLSSPNPADWDVAYEVAGKPHPLFTATDSAGKGQPITSRVLIAQPPAGMDGVRLFFGTGSYMLLTDDEVVGSQTQTFYSIHDNGSSIAETDRSTLQEQRVVVTTTDLGYQVRVTTKNPVDWAHQRGWYMDLPVEGERIVSVPTLRNGIVLFMTMIPSKNPCDKGGESWVMGVNGDNGGRPDFVVFDFDEDRDFNDTIDVIIPGENDNKKQAVAIGGYNTKVGLGDKTILENSDTSATLCAKGTKGKDCVDLGKIRMPSGRISWRELIE